MGGCALFGEEEPSFISIHPTVWRQLHQRYRQDRQTNGRPKTIKEARSPTSVYAENAEVEIRWKPHKRTVPLSMGKELGPHLTQCGLGRGLPPCQVSSRSIQPFGQNKATLQTDRTDRQTGQRSDSIGRTVSQTVAQKR